MTIKDAVQYLREVKVELSRVVWPKFNDFVGSTIVVLFLMCVFAVYLGLVDYGFSRLATYVFKYSIR